MMIIFIDCVSCSLVFVLFLPLLKLIFAVCYLIALEIWIFAASKREKEKRIQMYALMKNRLNENDKSDKKWVYLAFDYHLSSICLNFSGQHRCVAWLLNENKRKVKSSFQLIPLKCEKGKKVEPLLKGLFDKWPTESHILNPNKGMEKDFMRNVSFFLTIRDPGAVWEE